MMQIIQHLWDFILFLILLYGPVPLCFSLVLTNQNRESKPSLAHCLVVFLVSWCAIEISMSLFLGVLKQFTLNAVLLSELIILLFGLNIFFNIKQRKWQFFRNLLIINQPLSKFEILIVAAISCVGLILLHWMVTRPIIDYDSLWYHLPTMARWYQEASFVRLDEFTQPTGDWIAEQMGYYPYNWEVLCTLFIMPFREDFLVTFPNLIAWMMLGLTVYLLSLKIGAMRIHAMAASTLVMTIPTVILQVNTMHIDLPFASFFTASLYFALLYNRTNSPTDILMFLTSLGMLFGIKSSGVGYGLLLVTLLLLLEARKVFYRNNTNYVALSKFLNWLVLGILCLFWLGGFWYLKNLIDVGNPLGHVRIQLANILIFPGTLDLNRLRATSLAFVFEPKNLSHWRILLKQAIVWFQFPFVAIALQIVLMVRVFGKNRIKIRFEYLFSLIVLLILMGFLYWNTPYTAATYTATTTPTLVTSTVGQAFRYGIPLLSIMGIMAAVGATLTQVRDEGVVAIVLLSGILGILNSVIFYTSRFVSAFKTNIGGASVIVNSFLTGLKSNPEEAISKLMDMMGDNLLDLFLYIGFYIVVVGISWLGFKNLNHTNFSNLFIPRSLGRISVTIVLILVFTTTYATREKRDIQRTEVYGSIYKYIATNLKPNDNIGYLLSTRSYLFYGKNLNQRVLFTPDYSDSLSKWLSELKQQKIEVVAIGPLEARMMSSREISWIQNPNGPFTPVFAQDPNVGSVLYRLKL